MSIKRISDARKAIIKSRNAYEASQNQAKTEETNQLILASLIRLEKQMALSAKAMEVLGSSFGPQEDKKKDFRLRLQQLKADMEENSDVKDSAGELKKAVDTFIADENKMWKDTVEKKAQGQMSLLYELGKYTENPSAAETIRMKLSTNLTLMPQSVQGIEEYYKILRNAETITQKVSGSESVINFLHDVTAGTATLSDLNDEIRKWIYDRNLQTKFKIVISNS